MIQRDNAVAQVHSEFGAFALDRRLLFMAEMGSTSHGTSAEPIDDYDLMGVVIPPARHLIGLGQWQHWVRPPGEDGLDVTLFSLHKWVSLALKANPNVLGLLWLRPENVLHSQHPWQWIAAERDAFSSVHAYHTFTGYAHAQLTKLQNGAYKGYMGQKRKALVQQFGYDPKNAAHLIRLLRMGIEFLETGIMHVWREDREELRAIKRGEWSLERVQREAEVLFAKARAAKECSPLPAEPDTKRVEVALMETHRWVLEVESCRAPEERPPRA